MTTAQLLSARSAYVTKEIILAATKAGLDPVYSNTAQRIASGVIYHGGSVHAAIDAAKRYIAARVVRDELAHFEQPQDKYREPALWVGWLVFGAAIIVVAIEAAKIMAGVTS